MGANLLVDTCSLGGLLDEDKDGDTRDCLAETAEEDIVLLSSLGDGAVGMAEVGLDLMHGRGAERYESVLAALAEYVQVAFVEEDIR